MGDEKIKFKKLPIVLLTGVIFFSISNQSFAERIISNQLQEQVKVQKELTDEILLSYTEEDFANLYDILINFKDSNPGATEDELDEIATDFYIEAYNDKLNTINPSGYYDELLEDATGMNSQELALAKSYPSDLPAVYLTSKLANAEATRRYNSGAFLGNQDAFRHASWNALLVQRFYRLGKGTVTEVTAKTKMWTDAHENGAKNSGGLSTSQFSQDKTMDLLNNAAGRELTQTYYDSSEYLIFERVQYYVDNGLCKKIKTDKQMGYSFEQMKAIPTWNLYASNTTGKK